MSCKTSPFDLIAYRTMSARGNQFRLSGPTLVALHVPLSMLLCRFSILATVHALVVFGLGLLWALRGSRQQLVSWGAYVIGMEVLWRMSDAQVFWESGKYFLITAFALSALRDRRFNAPVLPLMYFLLLLPSVPLTFMAIDPANVRHQLSFNLSGPCALMVCTWFFNGIRLTPRDVHRMLVSAVAPLVGMTIVLLYGVASTEGIVFRPSTSNFVTSGGFGPNQVSAALGLGALMVFLIFWMESRRRAWFRFLCLATSLAMLGQSALTFSRGGLIMSIIAACLVMLYLLQIHAMRARVLGIVAAFALVAGLVILPELDRFTGGALGARFTDLSSSSRERIVKNEIESFAANPLLGLGPGVGRFDRHELVSAHTEFTRLLAEHGLLGATALLLLLLSLLLRLLKIRRIHSRLLMAVVLSLTVWAGLSMSVYGMRTAAPSYLIGLCFAAFSPPSGKLARGETQPAG